MGHRSICRYRSRSTSVPDHPCPLFSLLVPPVISPFSPFNQTTRRTASTLISHGSATEPCIMCAVTLSHTVPSCEPHGSFEAVRRWVFSLVTAVDYHLSTSGTRYGRVITIDEERGHTRRIGSWHDGTTGCTTKISGRGTGTDR